MGFWDEFKRLAAGDTAAEGENLPREVADTGPKPRPTVAPDAIAARKGAADAELTARGAPAVLPPDQIDPAALAKWNADRAAKGLPTLDANQVTQRAENTVNLGTPTGAPGFIGPPAPPPKPVMATPPPKPGAGAGAMGAGAGAAPNPYLQDLRAAWEAERAGVGAQAKGEQAINAATALGARREGAENANYGAGERKAAQDLEGDARVKQFDIDSLSRDLGSSKEDPNRWARSQTTGAKVGWTIAAFLGGLSAGWNHHSNHVLEQINREVDRDLAEQHSEIEAKKGRLADMRGALAESYRRYGVGQQQRAVAHAAALGDIVAQTQAMAAESNNPVVQAKADQLTAQLRQKQDEIMLRLTAPKGGAGVTPAQIAEKALEIAKFEAQNGRSITPEEARAKALAFYTGAGGQQGLAAKPGEGGAATAAIGQVPDTHGSNNNLLQHPINALTGALGIQGTEGYENKLAADRAATPVLGYAHKAWGARTPEAQREIWGENLPSPHDTAETAAVKARNRAAIISANGGVPPAAGLPEGSDTIGGD